MTKVDKPLSLFGGEIPATPFWEDVDIVKSAETNKVCEIIQLLFEGYPKKVMPMFEEYSKDMGAVDRDTYETVLSMFYFFIGRGVRHKLSKEEIEKDLKICGFNEKIISCFTNGFERNLEKLIQISKEKTLNINPKFLGVLWRLDDYISDIAGRSHGLLIFLKFKYLNLQGEAEHIAMEIRIDQLKALIDTLSEAYGEAIKWKEKSEIK